MSEFAGVCIRPSGERKVGEMQVGEVAKERGKFHCITDAWRERVRCKKWFVQGYGSRACLACMFVCLSRNL